MTMTVEAVAVLWQADNGSLPPPYRRSTEIEIDAAGRGRLLRVHGYDRNDPAQRFECMFTVEAARMQDFARRSEELGAWRTRWRERARVPVGGPLVHLRLLRGEQRVALPVFPVAAQREAVEALRGEVLAMLPAEATAARDAWEAARGGED